MKKRLLTLVCITLFFISNSFGQDAKPAKGYYSIPGKKGKLPANTNPVIVKSCVAKFPTVTKGYYSISGNEKKLPPALRIYIFPNALVAPKGYYSMPVK